MEGYRKATKYFSRSHDTILHGIVSEYFEQSCKVCKGEGKVPPESDDDEAGKLTSRPSEPKTRKATVVVELRREAFVDRESSVAASDTSTDLDRPKRAGSYKIGPFTTDLDVSNIVFGKRRKLGGVGTMDADEVQTETEDTELAPSTLEPELEPQPESDMNENNPITASSDLAEPSSDLVDPSSEVSEPVIPEPPAPSDLAIPKPPRRPQSKCSACKGTGINPKFIVEESESDDLEEDIELSEDMPKSKRSFADGKRPPKRPKAVEEHCTNCRDGLRTRFLGNEGYCAACYRYFRSYGKHRPPEVISALSQEPRTWAIESVASIPDRLAQIAVRRAEKRAEADKEREREREREWEKERENGTPRVRGRYARRRNSEEDDPSIAEESRKEKEKEKEYPIVSSDEEPDPAIDGLGVMERYLICLKQSGDDPELTAHITIPPKSINWREAIPRYIECLVESRRKEREWTYRKRCAHCRAKTDRDLCEECTGYLQLHGEPRPECLWRNDPESEDEELAGLTVQGT